MLLHRHRPSNYFAVGGFTLWNTHTMMAVEDCAEIVHLGIMRGTWCQIKLVKIDTINGLRFDRFLTTIWTSCFVTCQCSYRDPNEISLIMSKNLDMKYNNDIEQCVKLDYMLSNSFWILTKHEWLSHSHLEPLSHSCAKTVNQMQFMLFVFSTSKLEWMSLLKCVFCAFMLKLQSTDFELNLPSLGHQTALGW